MSLLVQIFQESKELKKTIVERSLKNEIPLKYICREAHVSYQDFMKQYINISSTSSLEIKDWQIQKILETIGIKIRFQFMIDTSLDMREEGIKLIKKYREESE